MLWRCEATWRRLPISTGPKQQKSTGRQAVRDSHPVLHSPRRLLEAAWSELRRLAEEAHSAVRYQCGTDCAVSLPRGAARDDPEAALISRRVLIVSGVSGAGKSALVCSALDHLVDTCADEFESVYLNLRHLPQQPAVLRAGLAAPLEDVLKEMSAPRRLVAVDAADRAAETDQTALAAIVRDAVAADASVCVITATEASEAVQGIVAAAAGEPPAVHTVPTLTEEEIDQLAAAFPAVRPMASNSRAREFLRRPVIADHLARADSGDTLLGEGAAMEVSWSRLVRRESREGRGNPDSRDQAMRQLAQHRLTPQDPDVLYAQMDGEALGGLRRDGILRASSRMGVPLPEFAHDILREFAVAKILASTGDPTERLREFDVPRWTLPVARLACESLLSGCEHSAESTASVFERLQTGFDALSAGGHSERWGFVSSTHTYW